MAKCGGTVTDLTQVTAFTTLARDFVTKVEILAEEETTAWAQRFSERLSSFDRNPSLKVSLNGEEPARRASNGSLNGGGTVNGDATRPAAKGDHQAHAAEQPNPAEQ